MGLIELLLVFIIALLLLDVLPVSSNTRNVIVAVILLFIFARVLGAV
jgi:hypothetical protein